MNIKRICSLLLAAVMGLSLTGCGGAPAEEDTPSALSANIRQGSVTEPEPESLPFFASLFGARKSAANSVKAVSGKIAEAAYPQTVPYPREEDFLDENGRFDNDA